MNIGDTDFGLQVSIGFLGNAATAAIAFGGSIFLARIIGPSGYGSFYLLMTIAMVMDNPVTGWAVACRKRLTEEDFPSGEALGSALIVTGLMLIPITIVVYLAQPLLYARTGNESAWILLVAIFFGIVSFRTTLNLLKSTGNFGASPWVQTARDVLRIGAQASLVVVGFGVTGMVTGIVFANLVVAPVVLYLIGIRPEVPRIETVKDIWGFARSSIPAGFVGSALTRIDILLLGTFASTAAIGNYQVAFMLTMPAMFVAGVAAGGLMGRVSNLRSQNAAFAQDITNNLSYASILAVPLFFGALTVGKPVVVTAYSSEFSNASIFLTGLALYRLLLSQNQVLRAVIDGLNRPDLNLKISTVTFLINTVAGVGLLFAMGPVGVVVATVVGQVLAYLARGVTVNRYVPDVEILPIPLLQQILSGLVMGLVVYGTRLALGAGSWQLVTLEVGIGGATYFVVLAALSHEFRETVFSIALDAYDVSKGLL